LPKNLSRTFYRLKKYRANYTESVIVVTLLKCTVIDTVDISSIVSVPVPISLFFIK